MSLSDEVAGHRSLEDVLRWGFGREGLHPHVIAEVIEQDEFSHDVLVPVGDRVVVYQAD